MERRRVGSEGPVPVPRDVLEGLEAVRRSGVVNMLAQSVVAHVAERMGFAAGARWVLENPGLYSRGVFGGFEVAEGTPTPP